MSKLELKSVLSGETILVTDEEFADIISKGNLRFYEVGARVEDTPKSVKTAIDNLAAKNGDPKSN